MKFRSAFNFQKTAKAGFCALAIMAVTGTATAFDPVDYLIDRGHDVLDIVRIRGGVPQRGEGYGAKARVTSLAQIGYVNFDGYYSGLNRRGFGTSHEDRTEGGLSVLYFSEHAMETTAGNVFLFESTDWAKIRQRNLERNKPYWDDGQGDVTGIGAEIATPVLALDLGIYPYEVLDFAAGIFTIDPKQDDRFSISRNPWDPMIPTTPPQPDPEAAGKPLRDQLRLQRAGFQTDDERLEYSESGPDETASTIEEIEIVVESNETEIDGVIVETDTLDQESVNEILENSQPVRRAETQPAVVPLN